MLFRARCHLHHFSPELWSSLHFPVVKRICSRYFYCMTWTFFPGFLQGPLIRFLNPPDLCQQHLHHVPIHLQTPASQTGKHDLQGCPQEIDRPIPTLNPTSVMEVSIPWPFWEERCLSSRYRRHLFFLAFDCFEMLFWTPELLNSSVTGWMVCTVLCWIPWSRALTWTPYAYSVEMATFNLSHVLIKASWSCLERNIVTM